MDSQPTRSHPLQMALIHKHINRLRDNPLYRSSRIVVIVENNLGMQGSTVEAMVHGLRDVEVFYENTENARPGILKTQHNTHQYQIVVEDLLMKDFICFDSGVFTNSVNYKNDVSKAMIELRSQMLRYHWEVKKASDVHGKDSVTLTGKMGGKQDDLYITLAMLAYWVLVYMRRASRMRV